MEKKTSLLASDYDSHLDSLRNGRLRWTVQLRTILFFAVLTIAGAKIQFPIWDIPFTLQTLAVYGSGLFLGAARGFLAQICYLAIGLFFPVTAGDGSGWEFMTSRVSSGYLLAFPSVAALVGFCSERWNSFPGSMLAAQMGSFLLFFCGVGWLYAALDNYFISQAVYDGWIKFIPFDLIKIVLISGIYCSIRKYYRK